MMAAVWRLFSLLFLIAVSRASEEEDIEAHRKLASSAKEGDVVAQFLLGQDYFWGQNGVKKDEETGLGLIIQAADGQDKGAQEMAGILYIQGHSDLIKKNVRKGVEYAEAAATQGSVKSMEALGKAFYNGTGLEHMREEGRMENSVRWYLAGAREGSLIAQADLADMYRLGKGTKQDYKKAIEWYQKVAANMDKVALASNPNSPPARANMTAVSKSMNNLGSMFAQGMGATKDFDKAISYFEEVMQSWLRP
ncbi:unnamed protein product [Polarella glacialis]|uniref:Sel1 repeat family protein n=2 Tax=Polarella glacialis TaxID=89957 RepID=A0A813D5Z2_POLGL|nr:unnamed protein product [Polarella glacialis]